jgi:hypothetical protein
LGPLVALLLAAAALPTFYPVAAAPPQAPKQDAGQTTAQRLQDLEARLQSVLKDLEALRRQQREATTAKQQFLGARLQEQYCLKCHVSAPQQQHSAKQALANYLGVATHDFDRDGQLDLYVAKACPGSQHWAYRQDGQDYHASFIQMLFKEVGQPASPKQAEVTLSRQTYPLPKAKAEALAKFLQEHVKARVMEPKVEGDKLTVTTTPEMQKAVGQLLGLLHKQP